jgi:hypothetical protein
MMSDLGDVRMSDDCSPDYERSEAIIANAMRLTSLVSVCLRAARHAGRHGRRPGELTADPDRIVREAFGDPDPSRWDVDAHRDHHAG